MHYPATTLLRTKWREGLGTFCPRVSSYMIEGYYRRADIDLSVAIEGGGILLITLLIAAAALIGGGVVVYRHSKGVGWRAGGMSALAVGISLLLFLATVFPIRSGGEAQEPVVSYQTVTSSHGEGFAIYLLAQDIAAWEIPIMSHLHLADSPIISMADVLSYSREEHEIELTPDAYERVMNLEVPVSGKAFAVCVDRHPVYCGAFWIPISSLPFNGITILKPHASEGHLIQLQLGYPSSKFFTGEDPRADQKTLQSLECVGKLR